MSKKHKKDKAPIASKFDIDDVVGNTKTDKQSFSRIKRIYAQDGKIFVEVDSTINPKEHGGRPLQNQVWSVKEAATRAVELNKMASIVGAADYKMIMEIVENTTAACQEAQQQMLKPSDKTIIVPGSDMP